MSYKDRLKLKTGAIMKKKISDALKQDMKNQDLAHQTRGMRPNPGIGKNPKDASEAFSREVLTARGEVEKLKRRTRRK